MPLSKIDHVSERLHSRLIELGLIPQADWEQSPHRSTSLDLAVTSVTALKDPTEAMIRASILLNGPEFNDAESIIATHNAIIDSVLPREPEPEESP